MQIPLPPTTIIATDRISLSHPFPRGQLTSMLQSPDELRALTRFFSIGAKVLYPCIMLEIVNLPDSLTSAGSTYSTIIFSPCTNSEPNSPSVLLLLKVYAPTLLVWSISYKYK